MTSIFFCCVCTGTLKLAIWAQEPFKIKGFSDSSDPAFCQIAQCLIVVLEHSVSTESPLWCLCIFISCLQEQFEFVDLDMAKDQLRTIANIILGILLPLQRETRLPTPLHPPTCSSASLSIFSVLISNLWPYGALNAGYGTTPV